MRSFIVALSVISATGALAQSPANSADGTGRDGGFLSRFRAGSAGASRENLAGESRQVAQPATSQQGYRPGVTFPQQQAQQPPQQYVPQNPGFTQNPAYQQPGLPGQAPVVPQPGQASNPQQQRSQEPSRSASSRSGSSEQSGSSSRSGSNSQRSGSSTSSSSRSGSSSNNTEKQTTSKASSSSDKKQTSPGNETSAKKTSDSPSALEKIVSKVEERKEGDSAGDAKKAAADKKKTDRAAAKAAEEAEKAAKEAEKAEAEANKAADEATTVVARFLKSANDGMYSKASDDLTEELQKYFNSEISAVNGSLKTVLDTLTHNGTITMVTYANTIVRGEGAVVEAELTFDDASSQRHNFDLVRSKDDWNIILPIGARGTARQSAVSAPAPPAQTPQPVVAAAPVVVQDTQTTTETIAVPSVAPQQ